MITHTELIHLNTLLKRVADQVAPTLSEPLDIIEHHDYLELRSWIAALARETAGHDRP